MNLIIEIVVIFKHNIYPFVVFYRAKLEETKLVQKLRVKPNGVNAVALAIGQKVTTEDLVLKVCFLYLFSIKTLEMVSVE